MPTLGWLMNQHEKMKPATFAVRFLYMSIALSNILYTFPFNRRFPPGTDFA